MKTILYPSFFSKNNRSLLHLCGMLLGLLFTYGSPTFAQITISEDFDYGTTSGNLTSQNGGTGFAAAWSGGTGAYTATGLSFGGLTNTGGAMIVASGSDARRQITTGFDAAGPISGSFLFKLNAATVNSSVLMLGLGTNASTNNQNHYLGFLPANDGQLGKPALGVRGTGISAMTGGAALTTGTTYLYAFAYDNGSTSAWILSLAQYNNFFNGSTLDQTAMNAATIGSAATNVTGKVTIATNALNLTTMNYLFSYYFSNGSLTVDRIRMSGTAALGGLGSAATTYTFNGTTNTDWATASNWSGGVVPTSANLVGGDAVVIASNCTITGGAISFPSGTSLTINASTTFTMTSTPTITVQSGATLTIDGTLAANNGTLNNAGTMTTAAAGNFSNPSGSFNNSGTFNHSGTSTSTYGGFTNTGTINNSGTLISSQYINVQNNGTFTNNSGGSVQFNGFINAANKTITNNGSMAAALDNAGAFINNNTFSFNYLGVSNRSGATLTNSVGATMNLGLLAFSNSGTFNNNGTYSMTQGSGLASFANTSTGIITNAGTMTIGTSVPATNAGTITNQASSTFTNNGTLSGAGTLTNNGTYKGTGTFSGSLFTNPSGSFVAPGNSPGCHTFSNGYTNSGTLQIELGGTTVCTQYDRLNITGTATLGGTLDVSLINSYTGSNGHQLIIINATTLSGTFSTVNLPINWYINYNLPSAGQVTLSYNAPIVAGAALSFDGSNDYVSVPDANVLDLGANLTLEAWVKPTSFSAYNIIIDKRTNTDATANYGLTLTNGKPMFYFWTNSSDSRFHTAPSAISLNTWSHIAATYDGAKVKLYVNGVLVYSQAETQLPPSTSQPLSIGRNPSSLQYFNGAIDEVRIWNTARTCAQISQQYSCELVGNESGLVAYYKFNQGAADSNNSSISSLTDATANGNHGTFNNFALSGSTSNFIATGGVTTGTSCPTVVAPEIDLQGGTPLASISSGDTSPTTSDGTDFGNVLVNGSLTRTFTISNTGNNTLNINDISSNNTKFTISNKPTSVAANSSATFDVLFNPTATGVQNATISVTNNDCDESPYTFLVTGTGTSAGSALDFDGTDDYVSFPTTGMTSTAGTISFWMNAATSQTVGVPVIVELGTENVAIFLYDNGTKIFFRAGWTSNQFSVPFTGLGTWKHIAMTWEGDGQLIKGYVDGAFVGSFTMSGNASFGTAGHLGRSSLYSNGSTNFKGALDDIRFYNRALCAEEISQLKGCEVAASSANLEVYFKCNQGVAASNNTSLTTLTDDATLIGGANDGTLFLFSLNGSSSNFISSGGVVTGTSCSALAMPEIDLKGGSPLVSIPDGTTSTSGTDNTNFGGALVNGSVVKTFTISNSTGASNLVVSSIGKSGTHQSEFTVGGASFPLTIAAGNTATFTVTFVPTALGTRTATIEVNSNDCDEALYTFAVTGAGANAGAALHFDGSNDLVTASGLLPTPPTQFTVEFWLKPESLSDYNQEISIGSASSGHWNGFAFHTTANGSVYVGTDMSSRMTPANIPDNTVVPNTWQHFAYVYNNGTGYFYKNGVLLYTRFNNAPPNFDVLRIGSGCCLPIQGGLDELRIWNMARTCEQINQQRNCELTGTEANLVAYYPFNQGLVDNDNSGITTLNDLATTIGGANNGTLTGFALTGTTSNWIASGGVISGTNCTAVVAPEINVQGGSPLVSILDGSSSTSTNNHTDFGSVSVSSSLERTFTIQNTGNDVLTLTNITSNNTTFVVSNVPTTVAANSSATFKVSFNPTASGAQNAVIIITNNDCDEATYDFNISGTGSCTAPSFSVCPSNQTASLGVGVCTATVNYTATASGIPTPTLSYVLTGATVGSGSGTGSGAVFNKGITTVTLKATNDCGSNATCTFDVTVNDTEAPLLNCPSNQTMTVASGSCTADYTITDPLSDNCSGATWGYTLSGATAKTVSGIADGTSSGAINFNIGTTTVTLTGTDGANSAVGCTFTVTVNAPEINVKGKGQDIADGTTGTSVLNDTNFGTTSGAAITRTFTIQNTGSAPLAISAITSSNTKFQVSALSSPSPLPSGSSATFTATFFPNSVTNQTAIISIINDDCNESTYDFEVSATSTLVNPNALHFDGSDDLIEVPMPTPLFGTNSTTVEFWAKGAPNFSFPINFTGSGTTIVLGPTLALAVYGDNTYFTGYPIEDCWHHYAFTYNGTTSTVYAYVDGQPTPTASFQGNFPTVSTNMWLGSRAGSYPWNGTMDELRVWNVQRTQAQIQANLFNELAGNESGLIAYYNFNQGIAGGDNTGNSTLLDAQTNSTARNGTMTGFTLNGIASNWVTSGGLQHYPEIDIQGNATPILDGDTSPADTDHTNFGDVFIGNSLVRTYTIKNTGTKELAISSIGSSNALFTVGSLSTASPLAVNATATFTITFTPTATGAQSATITVNNDDCNEAVYDFAVSGSSSCVATATISGTNSGICAGNNAVFTLTGTSGAVVTYNINGGSNVATTLSGGTATVTVSGVTANQKLNLISVNDGSCTLPLSASATVTVKPLPIINVPVTAICIGGNLTLSPNTGGVWSSSDESKATITNAGQVTAIESGNVKFTFTETVTGCSSTTSTISINVLPTSVVSGGGMLCSTEPLPNVSIALTGTGPWDLVYSNGTTSTSRTGITSSPHTIIGAAAGTYTVTSLSDANCTGTSMIGSALVKVNPMPTLVAGTVTSPTTCAGTNGSIAFTTTNLPDGDYSLTYTGTGSPKTVTVLSNKFTLGGLSAGAYSSFSIANNNCTGVESAVQVLIDPNPPAITLGAIPAICAGATSFTIPYTATTFSPITYSIAGAGIVSVTNQSLTPGLITVQLSAPASGNSISFTLTVKNGNQCVSLPLSGTVVVRPLPIASIQGTTIVCLNAPMPVIQFTGTSASVPYTFAYKLNGGATQTITTQSGNTASINAATTQAGVFTYTLVSASDNFGCSQSQSGIATVSVLTKPTVFLTTQQVIVNEGNIRTFCDIDANPVNSLQFSVSNSCVVGSPVWRTQVGNGAWSEWSSIAPVSQVSNNQPYRYQAACDPNCAITYTEPLSVTIHYRASTPQNVSLLANGVTVLPGESKTICSTEGSLLSFNGTCSLGEILLYSVDGGDYGSVIPTALLDNQTHNYRVRCRKSDGTTSCVETDSGVMSLKITTVPLTPTISISPENGCGTSMVFSGTSSCGSLKTVWYNATSNLALPNLPLTTPTETTSYYARCQSETGCLSEKSNNVTYSIIAVNTAPLVTSSADIVCSGVEVTLTATCPSGSSAAWNTGIEGNSFQVSFANVTTQSYWAYCKASNGCQSPASQPKKITWKAFEITLINIGQSKSAIKTNDRAAWSGQFITSDSGPELELSTQNNPTLYHVENLNKTAPRYWTVYVEECAFGTSGSLTFDMLVTPEVGVPQSFNTHENNAPYFMYANRDGFTELYAQNHPAYGFFTDNGNGGNAYDAGLPKGLYKLSIRYWDQKGWGSIFPSTRKPQGNVLAYQEYWFRIQSKEGVGVGAARSTNGKTTYDSDIEQQKTDNSVFASVFPNPSSNALRLKVQNSKSQKVQATLNDALGREVFTRSFVPQTHSHQEEFAVGTLQSGIYFLNVKKEAEEVILKVIKVP